MADLVIFNFKADAALIQDVLNLPLFKDRLQNRASYRHNLVSQFLNSTANSAADALRSTIPIHAAGGGQLRQAITVKQAKPGTQSQAQVVLKDGVHYNNYPTKKAIEAARSSTAKSVKGKTVTRPARNPNAGETAPSGAINVKNVSRSTQQQREATTLLRQAQSVGVDAGSLRAPRTTEALERFRNAFERSLPAVLRERERLVKEGRTRVPKIFLGAASVLSNAELAFLLNAGGRKDTSVVVSRGKKSNLLTAGLEPSVGQAGIGITRRPRNLYERNPVKAYLESVPDSLTRVVDREDAKKPGGGKSAASILVGKKGTAGRQFREALEARSSLRIDQQIKLRKLEGQKNKYSETIEDAQKYILRAKAVAAKSVEKGRVSRFKFAKKVILEAEETIDRYQRLVRDIENRVLKKREELVEKNKASIIESLLRPRAASARTERIAFVRAREETQKRMASGEIEKISVPEISKAARITAEKQLNRKGTKGREFLRTRTSEPASGYTPVSKGAQTRNWISDANVQFRERLREESRPVTEKISIGLASDLNALLLENIKTVQGISAPKLPRSR